MEYKIREAGRLDATTVGELVGKLLQEIVGHIRTVDSNALGETAHDLLARPENFRAFVAQLDSGRVVGAMTVSVSAALYAGGIHGVIEELYVEPEFRSTGVGRDLINFVVAFGKNLRWSRLEVSTPEGDEWQSTVRFYEREGFVSNHTGVRLKLGLS